MTWTHTDSLNRPKKAHGTLYPFPCCGNLACPIHGNWYDDNLCSLLTSTVVFLSGLPLPCSVSTRSFEMGHFAHINGWFAVQYDHDDLQNVMARWLHF